ncbi:hypothetical protein DPMN_113849 [Dreissena polymorpha]|uniref:Uncharacterized protein n=1 Tax=Dreissena polymorpha TaxID=45954 RepID=A0A9D4KJS4_DREPO|nr:hypothetical protein DPMN_113849 [Dreissena polymorpha]
MNTTIYQLSLLVPGPWPNHNLETASAGGQNEEINSSPLKENEDDQTTKHQAGSVGPGITTTEDSTSSLRGGGDNEEGTHIAPGFNIASIARKDVVKSVISCTLLSRFISIRIVARPHDIVIALAYAPTSD